ncbi:MAG TPA: tyrosine-type recombinase/integrase, partial [Flavobacteriales bacterium]|nr:tyrosine-type recombinase/integrase [Flavobacteriales bacterium]
INIYLTKDDFRKITSGKRLSEELMEIKTRIEMTQQRAQEACKGMIRFDKEEFLKRFNGESVKQENVVYSIRVAFDRSKAKEGIKIATRLCYQTSLIAINRYLVNRKLSVDAVEITKVNVDFLKGLHAYLLDEGLSFATIGIYMRTFRAVINEAMALGKITPQDYPFGRRKYVPPVAKSTKDVLAKNELKAMIELKLEPLSLECFSRDWFLMSYLCYGMNIGDLLNLKNKNLRQGGFHFIREKTKTTSGGGPDHIRVDFGQSWKDLIWEIIERQRSNRTEADEYLFPYYESGMDERRRMRTKLIMIRKVNQHLPKVCKLAGITKKVSTQTARHSFASNLYQGDVSIAEIQQMLGHTSPRTTENYLHSLRTDRTNKAIENLLSLDDQK